MLIFQVMPIVVWFSAVSAVLQHWGILQPVVAWVGGAVKLIVGTHRVRYTVCCPRKRECWLTHCCCACMEVLSAIHMQGKKCLCLQFAIQKSHYFSQLLIASTLNCDELFTHNVCFHNYCFYFTSIVEFCWIKNRYSHIYVLFNYTLCFYC